MGLIARADQSGTTNLRLDVSLLQWTLGSPLPSLQEHKKEVARLGEAADTTFAH